MIQGLKDLNYGSGVHVGTEEPEDERVDVWIDTDDDAQGTGVYVGEEAPTDERFEVWIDTDDGGNLYESPTLTGVPTAPTPSAATNNNQIATTAFVHNAIEGTKGVIFVEGTQSEVTNVWEGVLPEGTTLSDGLAINYRLPYDSTGSDVTLSLTGTAIPVYYTGNRRMTTEYPAQSIIPLVYYQGAWRGADYDSGTNARESALEAEQSALEAEGYTKGTQYGTAVDNTSEYYQDNAKYYKEQAEAERTAAEIAKGLAQAAAATASAAYDVNLIAPNYSDLTFPVAAGTHCIYDGGYYKAITDISSQEAWAAEHWTQETVGKELTDLLRAVTNGYVVNVASNQNNDCLIITYSNGTTANIPVSSMTFDGGYVEDGLLHLTMDGEDIDNYTPIQIPDGRGMAFDGGYVDEDYLMHLTLDGNDVEGFTPFALPAGGGGGSSAGNVSVTRITNASTDCIYGDDMNIEFSFAATDSSGDPVGNGIGTWSVGGIVVARNITVAQGNNSFNIRPYLAPGANNVRISVSVDTGGSQPQTTTKTWTINAVNMYFTWPYVDEQINTDGFVDRWTVYGEIEKTTHTVLDGVAQGDITTTRNGYVQTMEIPMLSHGVHTMERWLTATINNEPQSTKHQYHELIFVEDGNTTPIVSISMQETDMLQYDTLAIPYVVYDPANVTTDVELLVDGVSVGIVSDVDRSLHHWYYTPTVHGAQTVTVKCGATLRSVVLNVEQVEVNADEVQGYSFRFKASDMVSNNAVRSWNSNGVNASFSQNFDWVNGGLHTETDSSGAIQQYLCIKAGTRMTINHKLFGNDPRSAGMNFKIIFKAVNCRNYDANIMHCYADGVGIRMDAHKAYFNSSGMQVDVPYGEDSYMELEFDVYPAPRQPNDGNYRYMMAWLDGVITSCRVYGASDNFVQSIANQENIVLGSDDCDLYIYMVKAYPMLITRDNHIDNFIMDAPNAGEMMRRYRRNDILDVSGEISYEKLYQNNPDCRVWTWDIPYLTNGKKDKVSGCQFHQFWQNGDSYYELSGTGTMTIQGTSSVNYIRGAANTDINFKALEDGNGNDLLEGGTEDEDYGNNIFFEDTENPGHAKIFTAEEAAEEAGSTTLGPEWVVVTRDSDRNPTHYIKALGFKLGDDSCPITYSNTKVNFASCEQVNNMCNAAWYQRYNPYPSLTARDCMEFQMGVQFIRDSGNIPDTSHFVLWGDDKYHMYSIANMGNSKKNVHVIHDLSNPNEVCIEVNDNNADQMRMVSDDLSAEDWSGDVYYGMRYPDTKNPSQEIRDAWQRLVTWMATRNPGAATGDRLTQAETYGPYTFRGHDRSGLQVLRGTTVTQYAGTYTHDTFERRMAKMLSECEDYMVMDSFIYHFVYLERHTMVDNVSKNNFWSSTDLVHWDLSKAYDMDTSDGNNNQGQMVFDYGNEYDDYIGDMRVFNGGDSVWFVFCANLYEACRTMFLNREAAGAWSATAYHAFLLEQQQKVPERCWVQCYWYDYLRTYEQNISDEWMTFLDGGQKTHQREHYEYYEELYDSSKYRGSASTSRNVNFRVYTPNQWINTVSNENGLSVYESADGSASILFTIPYGDAVTVTQKVDDEWRKISYNGSEYYALRSSLSGVEPTNEITVTMYNKMYLSVNIGTTALAPIKVARGDPYTIDFSELGLLNNTLTIINTAPMIQAIEGLEHLYPDTCVFSEAIRLRTLQIGSDEAGYENTFLRTLALGNNTMLEYLYAQNLPNANSVLDLSQCTSLTYMDASGSAFTGYEFADGGALVTAICEAPTSLILMNLAYLLDENFTVNDYSRLVTLRHENTPGVSSRGIVEASDALQIARIIGLNWRMSDTDLLEAMYAKQGLDESGYTTSRSVMTGSAYVPLLKQSQLQKYNTAWPGLDLSYGTVVTQYTATFVDWDGNPILDLEGNPYIQYVDASEYAYDPIVAGEVLTPTRAMDEAYSYVFSEWSGIGSAFFTDRTIRATYASTVRTFTVEWYMGAPYGSEGTLLKRLTDVAYGASVVYSSEGDTPKFTEQESLRNYYVFNGWDKSTGFVRPDPDADPDEPNTIKVHALWITGALPDPSESLGLAAMNWAQRYGVGRVMRATRDDGTPDNEITADDYWDLEEYMDFTLGHGDDMNFTNVESETLISEPTYFDGTAPLIFNGENGLPSIQLFNGSVDRFTLAIDYEFTSDSGVLAACFNDSGNEGFQFRRSGNYANVMWGNDQMNLGYKYQRGMMVIRYNRGQYPLVLYVAHDGNMSDGEYTVNASNPDSNVTTDARVRSVETTTEAPLTFGGIGYMNGSDVSSLRGTGWIHWAKIWYDDIGIDNAHLICAMPHIPVRFAYTGIEYRDALDSVTTVAAGFQSVGALPLKGGINYTDTNAGGWPASHRRAWLNGQFFAGLPFPVQSMICDARVRSTEGGGTSTVHALGIVNSMDKVYLPAYAEIFSTVTGNNTDNSAYVDECDDLQHRIPGFIYDSTKGQSNDNHTRIKFPGIILGDDANFVVGTSDPTTPGLGHTVRSEKTVWIRTDNSSNGWIYLDADYVTKHKFYIGRQYTDTSNIRNAAGPDSDGNSGGKWVLAQLWWSRSPYVASSTYFWFVYASGGSVNYNASYAYGLAPAFSI